jgi:hypothetical protein
MHRPPILPLALTALTLLTAPAAAQGEEEPERCPRFVASIPYPMPASFIVPVQARGEGQVRLTFIGHATFLIESPAGVTIATDYSDASRPSIVPDIVTMNRAHSTHFTFSPDPGIDHVRRAGARMASRHGMSSPCAMSGSETSRPISAVASACLRASSAT